MLNTSSISQNKVSDKAKKILSILLDNDETNKYLNMLKEYHLGTYQHSIRVGLLAIEMGINNSIENDDDLILLGNGGLLHDLGKVKIPIEILTKKGGLTSEERDVINLHPRLGFELLSDFSDENVKKIVVGHHEFHRENSYPRKISVPVDIENRTHNNKVEMMTEIVAIVDVYDALVSRREYKDSFPTEKVEKIMTDPDFIWNLDYVYQLL